MLHSSAATSMPSSLHNPVDDSIIKRVRNVFAQPMLMGVAGAAGVSDLIINSSHTGVPHLFHRDGSTGEQRQLTFGEQAVVGPVALHPTGDSVAFVRDRGGDGRHRVYHVNLSTGHEVAHNDDPVGTIYHLLWAQDADSLVAVGFDQETVFARLLQRGGIVRDLYTTDRQIFCAAVDDSRNLVALAVGRGPGTQIVLVDVIGRNEPYTIDEPAGSENTLPALLSEQGLLAYISRVADGEQYVVMRDVNSLEEISRFAVPESVGDADFMVSQLLWENPHTLILSASRHARIQAHRLTTTTGTWSHLATAGSLHNMALTVDGIVAIESGIGHAPRLIMLDEDIARSHPADSTFARAESHWYESFDGRRVHGWLMRAARSDAPLVVYAHGGPSFFTGDWWDPYMQAMVQCGFHVFAPNFRGSTSFGAMFRDLNLGDVGGGDLQDVLCGARYASEILGLKSKPAITGDSYGGYLTLLALTTQAEEWAGGVAVVPIADWRESYERANAHYRRFAIHFMGGTPDEKPDLYRDRSPITHVDNLRTPLLIIHGLNDPVCPIQPVQRFVDEATKLGHTIRLYVEEDSGHGSIVNEQAISEVTEMIEHLKRVFR